MRFPAAVVPDSCELQKTECATLQQKCAYGMEKWVDNNECENCRCYDPCRNLEQRCPPNTQCAVDFYRNEQTGATEYKAVCRLGKFIPTYFYYTDLFNAEQLNLPIPLYLFS